MPAQAFKNLDRQSRILTEATHPRLWRSLLTSSRENKILVETQGTDFVAWSKQSTKGTNKLHSSAIQPLNAASLKQVLSAFDYSALPVSIVLHPPCVCLKTFQLDTNDAGKWLATHLAEITPPGNRRDQVMSYQCDKSGALFVAFTRRTFLTEMGELLYNSRVSVKEILVGGVIAATTTTDLMPEHDGLRTDFALCNYTTSHNDKGTQVYPNLNLYCSTTLAQPDSQQSARASNNEQPAAKEISHAATDAPIFMTNSLPVHDLDFRTQLGLPGSLPIDGIQRIARTTIKLLVTVIVLLSLSWGAQAIVGREGSDPDIQSAVSALAHIRQVNEGLVMELDQALSSRSPRFTACTFLKTVALATPQQAWLTSITYSNSSTSTNCAFSLNGYSLGGDEPLRFIDSLRTNRAIHTVNLTKGNLVENPSRRQEPQGNRERLTKFEITGQYANR